MLNRRPFIWARVLDTFHAALLMIVYYHYAVTHFGDYETLAEANW